MEDILDKSTEKMDRYEVDEEQLKYSVISVLWNEVADRIFREWKKQENYIDRWVFYIGKYERYIDEEMKEIFKYVEINEIESFFQALDQLSREKDLENYNAMILTVGEIKQFNEHLQEATISSDISKLKDFIGEQIEENPSIDYLVDKAIDASKVTKKHLEKKDIDKETLKKMFSDIEELFYTKLQNNFEWYLSKDTIHNMSTGYVLYLLETFNDSTNEEREKLDYSFQEFISWSMPNKFIDWMWWIGSVPRLSKFFKNIDNTTNKLKSQIVAKNINPSNSEQVSQLNNPIEFKDLLLITEQWKDIDLIVDKTWKKIDRLAVAVDVNTRENIKKMATFIDNKAVGNTMFLWQSLKFSIDNLKHVIETEDIWNKIQFFSKNPLFGDSIKSVISFFMWFFYKEGLAGYENSMQSKMARKYTIAFADFLENTEDFGNYIVDIDSANDFVFDNKIVDYIGEMQYIWSIEGEEPQWIFDLLFKKNSDFANFLEAKNINIFKNWKIDLWLLNQWLKVFIWENKWNIVENIASNTSFKSYDELIQLYPNWEKYGNYIETYSNRLLVPKNVALQLFVKENSQADSKIKNPFGSAYGLTQITDSTWGFITSNLWKKYGIDLNWDRHNVDHQISAAMIYLKYQYDRYGDWWNAIVAYHTGSLNFSNTKAIKYAEDNPAVSKWRSITDSFSYIEAYKDYLLS